MRKIWPFISPWPFVMMAAKRDFSSFTKIPESTPSGARTAVAAVPAATGANSFRPIACIAARVMAEIVSAFSISILRPVTRSPFGFSGVAACAAIQSSAAPRAAISATAGVYALSPFLAFLRSLRKSK